MLSITNKEYRLLADYIRRNYGINLKEEKKALVIGRLNSEVRQMDFTNFSAYFDYLLADKSGAALRRMIDRITTNHTFFMREEEHFHFFKNTALPYLVSNARDKDLRIWSAGCSTGEEPGTLAMLIDEYLGREKALWDSKLLATDISGKVLHIASRGIYENEKLKKLPSHWRLNYFKKLDGEKSILIDRIRKEIIYRKFNLMDEIFPFKRKFQVIFCRNVMIYFDDRTRKNLVNKFYEFTEPGGYLFIGHSESLKRADTRYKYIMPAIFRKE